MTISMIDFFVWVFLPWTGAGLIAAGVIWYRRMFNVPIVILRFTGDKRRPNLIMTKGRKVVINNCVELQVWGYKRRFRDFIAENYYPSPGTKFGGIIVFEFEDGWLTPLRTGWKRLTNEQRAKVSGLVKEIENITNIVDFDYNKAVHDALKLEIVDDVDSETYLIDQSRLKEQYRSWGQWLAEHATLVVLVVLIVCGLVGFIFWVKENPANAAQVCVAQLRDVCRDAWNVTIVENKEYARGLIDTLVPPPPG